MEESEPDFKDDVKANPQHTLEYHIHQQVAHTPSDQSTPHDSSFGSKLAAVMKARLGILQATHIQQKT